MLYNSIAIIDANGELLGNYRKTHIPDGSGYQEKFYFSPGDTGFRVYDTMYAKIGVAICWDQVSFNDQIIISCGQFYFSPLHFLCKFVVFHYCNNSTLL